MHFEMNAQNLRSQFTRLLFILITLTAALQFTGDQLWILSTILILLLSGWGIAAVQAYPKGIRLPRTGITLFLTLFWAWLAIAALASEVRPVSVIHFWWLSAFPLAFLIYTLHPDRENIWNTASRLTLFFGVLLAVYSVYQVFGANEQARSLFLNRNSHAAFLNMIALPASAYFLIALQQKKYSWKSTFLLGLTLLGVFYSIMLASSRGAILCLAIAMALLIAVSFKHISTRHLALLTALPLVAYLMKTLIQPPVSAVSLRPSLFEAQDRMMIWTKAWAMLHDAPWHGIGPGIFYLAWPPYRDPRDGSAGSFVHNDYLQLWIETGLLGLALFLAVLLAVLFLFWKMASNTKIPARKKIEAAGLFGGLLAVAIHSFVDFNFYVLSIGMVAGIVLGRFNYLAQAKLELLIVYPSKIIKKKNYIMIIVISILVPTLSLAGLGIGDFIAQQARQQARRGDLEAANKNFRSATVFAPSDDRLYSAHADLLRQGIPLLNADNEVGKKKLFKAAVDLLEKAEKINPLRWDTYANRGMLYHENLDLGGPESRELSELAYRRALARNPFLYATRTNYANLLAMQGETQQAEKVLSEGMDLAYPDHYDLIPYYKTTISFLRSEDKLAEANIMQNKLDDLMIRLNVAADRHRS